MNFLKLHLVRLADIYESLLNRDGPKPWKAAFYIICLALLKFYVTTSLLSLLAKFPIILKMFIVQGFIELVNFLIGLLTYYSLIKNYYGTDIKQFIALPPPEKKYLALILSVFIFALIGSLFSWIIIIVYFVLRIFF